MALAIAQMVLPVLLVIALGYLLKRIRFFKPFDYRLITKLVFTLTLPAVS